MVLETTGVEAPEVAAPETPVETGEKTPEVATPGEAGQNPPTEAPEAPPRDLEKDAAFAKLRREAEEARRQAAVAQEATKALSAMFGDNDPIAHAYSYATGKPLEIVQAERQAQSAAEALREENQRLKQELTVKEAESAIQRDLREIRKIDPKVKSLDDLGETFMSLIASGKVSAIDAYYATQARREKETKTPPPTMGKVNTSPAEKDFYTPDEVKAMTTEEVRKNLDKINKSMSKW